MAEVTCSIGWSARQISVRRCMGRLQKALDRAKSPAEAASQGQHNISASMTLRKLHGIFGGDAQGKHCRELYRSVEANELLSESLDSKATVIHCEHTIPVCVAVRQLWHISQVSRQISMSDSDREMALLTQVFRNTVVTACSQRERHCKSGLAKSRSYQSHPRPRVWSRHHPEFVAGCTAWQSSLRPFLRYHGTTIRVICAASGQKIDLESYTLEDHWNHIGLTPEYKAANYF